MVNPEVLDEIVETPVTLVIDQEIVWDSTKSVSEQLTVTDDSVSVDAGASTVISKGGNISE